MKKSSVVILTIVAALGISSCAVQKTSENLGPPDPVYAEQVSDTTRNQQIQQQTYYSMQAPSYGYYYRSYFWDDMYRIFFPNRYYTAISKPGFVPHRLRPARGDLAHTGHSRGHTGRRGGFGHHGSASAAHA